MDSTRRDPAVESEGLNAPGATVAEAGTTAPTSAPHSQPDPCQVLWDSVLAQEAVPGAPRFEAQRGLLLARAKAEPILLLKTPEWAPASSGAVESFRRHLEGATHHWDVLSFQLGRFRARPDIGREVLLRDGYLYSEHPHMAYAIDQQVRLEHLFKEKHVWIQRGERVYRATRTREATYIYDTPHLSSPQEVRLLHLDRVGVGTPPAPQHVDVRALRARLHFDRMRVVHLTREHLLAELQYPDLTLRSVLTIEGAHLSVACDVKGSEEEARVSLAREHAATRHAAVRRLQQSMHDQVLDALPFDEPRHEVGDQDGTLRRRWLHAYNRGRRSFRHDNVDYSVFTRLGQPRPPQVCVDFLTDTLERASGRWWNDSSQPRGRSQGGLDLSQFERLNRRRIPNLLDFAESKPEWFDLYATETSERTALGRRDRFFLDLKQHADRYNAGDIVIVRGHTKEDPDRMHYHSFFVYETDPITGVPIAIVGNAGMPHIWSFEDESRRAPQRSIQYRLRPRLPLLERILAPTSSQTPAQSQAPAPLVEEAI